MRARRSISRKSIPFNNLICYLDVRRIPGAVHRERRPFGAMSVHEYLMEDDVAGGAGHDVRAAAPDAQDRNLTVVVYDYAGLTDSSMNEVESLGAMLLSRAGIRAQWVHCLAHQPGSRPALCDGNLETGSVMIRILKARVGQPNKIGDPLGWAEVESSYASLDASAIGKYADHNGLPAANLMAYAATHEIGHLLLGEKHAPTGIMWAAWGKTEYREMAQRWLGFSDAER
jgi:hypothetical protein